MMNINWCGRVNDGIDRISSLPDDVRKHILSFLSTREAVQTCILSKRWINTWASVLDLKFDMEEFIDDDMEEFGLPEIIEDMDVKLVTKFELFVKSVLEKREISCVNMFQLWLDSGFYWPCTQAVPDCICDAIKLEPPEFLVKLRSCENFNLNTDLIFTCASLIHLQLHLSSKVDPFVAMEPNSINLPFLKTVNLYGVIMSDDSLKKLLLGCHVLEVLVLERFYIEGIIKICSNTSKKLVLRNNHDYHDVMRLQISTPNLMYLVISMRTSEILLLNMPLLVYASINIPGWYDQDIYLTMGPKLIHNLSNVESLRLELYCPEGKVQKKDFSNCPVFNNLKQLELVMTRVFYISARSWGFYVFDLVPFFLHQSPELQELTLYGNAMVTEFVEEEATQEGPRDALVQREFLKTVRIVGCNNDNGFVNRLINRLLAHVKIIVNLITNIFIFVDLTQISVGDKSVILYPETDFTYGVILDTIIPVTLLAERAYGKVKSVIVAQIGLPVNNPSSSFEMCYDNSPYWPNIALSFSAPTGNSRYAQIVLRKENYVVTDDNSGLECVAILPTSNQGFSVIGSMAQLNREKIFDLDRNNLYFDQYPEIRFSCDTKPTIALNLVVVYFIILLLCR